MTEPKRGRPRRDPNAAAKRVTVWLAPAELQRLRETGEAYSEVMMRGVRAAESGEDGR